MINSKIASKGPKKKKRGTKELDMHGMTQEELIAA